MNSRTIYRRRLFPDNYKCFMCSVASGYWYNYTCHTSHCMNWIPAELL